MDTDTKEQKPTAQIITEITLGSLCASAINGIVGFIAVYFFKPMWDKLVSYWKNK